jgi:outer membrane protein assembly factor BamE
LGIIPVQINKDHYKNMLYRILFLVAALSLSACSSWVYRIDIPQGNYLEQKNIDKLQLNMTKEQVKFVLGSPVMVDSFNDDIWHYVYRFKSGKSASFNSEKKFIVKFEDNKLVSAEGDFELPESYFEKMVH